MKKASIIVLALLVLVTAPALAYSYIAPITVVESDSNSYTQLPIIASVNNQYLADSGYISNSGLDTRVLEASDELKHMLTDDKLLFCADISAGEQSNFDYTLGNTALDNFYLIVGYGGYVTVDDDDTIEFGDDFTIEIKGFVQTTHSNYTDRNLIYKANAFRLYVSAAGTITATMNPGGTETTVDAVGVSSAIHIVKVDANGTDLKIYIDGAEKDTEAIAAGVVDNGNNITMLQNNVMPYMEYMKWWVA